MAGHLKKQKKNPSTWRFCVLGKAKQHILADSYGDRSTAPKECATPQAQLV